MNKMWIMLAGALDLVVFFATVILGFTTEINGALLIVLSLGVIGIGTFVGFYLAGLDMRSAIAASIMLFYLILLAHLLLVPDLRTDLDTEFGKEILATFTTLVTTVVTFYVGASAAVKGTQIVAEERTRRAAIDAHEPPPPHAGPEQDLR